MAPNGTSNDTSNGTNGNFDGNVPLIIGGKDVTTSKKIKINNPQNGEFLWTASMASKADAIASVEAAQAAFPSWSQTKPIKIRDILLKAAEIFEQRGEEAAEYMTQETAAPAAFGMGFNVPASAAMLRDIAGRLVTINHTIPMVEENGRSAMVLKVPYGVVLGIAPWNAPYVLGFRAAVYAIATGNTAVLKGSEACPRTFWLIGDVLRQAGLPEGVLSVLSIAAEDAGEAITAMIEHPAVRKINYTGSTNIGRVIARTAGNVVKPCLMELGGKASAIVFADADLAAAAKHTVLGAFIHSGQVCMSTERIVVEKSILKDFIKAFKETVEQIYASNGPSPVLVSPVGVKKNKALVSDVVSKGGEIVLGDHTVDGDFPTHMRPVAVTGITREMNIYQEESFGPTVSILSFDTEEEALDIANDTEYGLAGAVFTTDLRKGLRVAKKYHTGAVHINAMTIHDEPTLPHGGMKSSGFGRFGESAGLEEFLVTKTITWDD